MPFSMTRRESCPCAPRGQTPQPDIEASPALRQPFLRPQWHSETRALRTPARDEKLLQVAIAPRSRQPDVPGPEGVAQMEQHRDFPKAVVAAGLCAKMTMPFRAGPQKGDRRIDVQTVRSIATASRSGARPARPAVEQAQHPRARRGGNGDSRRAHD
jgi:hypothetical protein